VQPSHGLAVDEGEVRQKAGEQTLIAISRTDFRIAEQKVLYKTSGSALRMVVENTRTQT
jgi:hypothetical protein